MAEAAFPVMITTRIALLSLAFGSPILAADRTWQGTTGSYSSAGNWNGGVVPGTADNAIVGNNGTVQIQSTDAAWTLNDVRAGSVVGAGGTYQQLGSTVQLSSWLRLGLVAGSTGTYTLQGGALKFHLNAGGHVHIGEAGAGVFNMSGGTVTATNGSHIILGDRDTGDLGSATATGVVNQSGGTFTSANEMWIGQGSAGAGTLAGTYNLSGTGQLNMSNWVAIGRNGSTGAMNISGGAFTKSGTSNNLILGHSGGKGTITQSGGTVTNTTGTWFGEGGGTGVYTLSGTGVATLGSIDLAYSATSNGTFNLDGGTLTTTGFQAPLPATAKVSLNGGTLKAGTDNRQFLSEAIDTVEVNAGGAVIDTNGHAITIGRGMTGSSGAGGLKKLGAGILTLTGMHTFSGPVDIAAGTLEVTGALASAPATASSVSGTIGRLTTGSLTFTSGSSFEAQINSTLVLADLVQVNGDLNLGGAQLLLSDLAAAPLPAGTRLTLAAYTGTLSGSFANAADGALLVVGANRFLLNEYDGSAITLTVPADGVGAAYATWATAKGLTGQNSASSADPDGDGLTNLTEFAIASDPLSNAARGSVAMQTQDSLSLTLPVRNGAVFSGTASLSSAAVDGVIYTIESSADLVSFASIEVNEVTPALSTGLPALPDGWSYRSFRAAPVAGPHQFIRYSITAAP